MSRADCQFPSFFGGEYMLTHIGDRMEMDENSLRSISIKVMVKEIG